MPTMELRHARDVIKSLHRKTLTKPPAKMAAGTMFLGGSHKPDTAIMQPIPDYAIPFLPFFKTVSRDFRYARTSNQI
jgi:hypothetical protein